LIGQTLSHYRITAKLGEGGMGEVYLAEDEKLERKVALKVLPAEVASDPDRLRRLQREARALAALDHPNIVTVFSVEEDDRLHFLTMAHVEGDDLDTLIPEEGFSVERLLELAIPLADALRAAHERGIIHRDLKPGNVMVDSEGRLRVLDFGLARREVAAGPDDETALASATMTKVGTVMGTYPYMSPEQAQGQMADARSDLFSLGIILYEMATGRRPFAGETGVSLISSILKDAPTPVTDLKAGLPEELGEIIGKCLEKDPADRFASAEELRDRLEALRREVQAGQTIVSKRWASVVTPRRRRLVLVVALVVVAALAGIYAWMTIPKVGLPDDAALAEATGPRITSLAVLPLKNFSGDPEQAYFVDGMTEALITDLSKIGALKVISRTSAMQYKDSDKSLREIASELGVEAVIEGSVLREGGRVGITAQLIEAATDQTLWADRYERDLTSILALQGEIARAVAGEIEVTLTPQERTLLSSAREVDPEAHEAYLKGMFHLRRFTPQDFQTSLQYFETALGIDPDYALAHYGVSQVWNYMFVLGMEQPLVAGPKALEAVTRALDLDDSLAEAYLGLGNIKTSHLWEWEEAEEAFLRAIELNPNYAEARIFYSHLLLILDRTDEALEQCALALELDPLEPFFRAAYAVVLGYSGSPHDAIEVFREIYQNAPGFGFLHQPLFRMLAWTGELDEALEHAKLHLTTVGELDAVAAMEQGYAEGGYVEAMRQAADSLAAGSHLATARPYFIADLYEDAGETDKALDWIERAYEIKDIDIAYLGVSVHSEDVIASPRFLAVMDKLGTPLLRQ
jgi:serine/threonine protein kinase/lipoprotein NlpI